MTYTGQRNSDGRPHGHGTETDGFSKYTGEFKDGERNGLGTYTWPDGPTYTGEFKAGRPAP